LQRDADKLTNRRGGRSGHGIYREKSQTIKTEDTLAQVDCEKDGEALKANAPHLRAPTLREMAVVMLYHMRAMMTMTFDPDAPNTPGAPEELRISVRSYLAARLR
jgi:hypothetical protein